MDQSTLHEMIQNPIVDQNPKVEYYMKPTLSFKSRSEGGENSTPSLLHFPHRIDDAKRQQEKKILREMFSRSKTNSLKTFYLP